MPFEPDPYRTLGLARGATLDEVKRAYRRLAKVNHPDAAGPAALTRFLAIQAAYEQLAGPQATARGSPRTGDSDRPAAAGRPRTPPQPGPRSRPDPAAGRRTRDDRTRERTDRRSSSDASPPGRTARGKATLGSTSYDGADAGPFEPDWGGASWYGTTSGTYWTLNPKEYADPRKHGPEYQARARRTAGARGAAPPSGDPGPEPGGAPTHTTASWWDSTAGPEETAGEGSSAGPESGIDWSGGAGDASPGPSRRETRTADGARAPRDAAPRPATGGDGTALDPAQAVVDLVRALTDPRSGGVRGRLVRAVIGWLPIALGIGWLVGEMTGCGRFAATCDPAVTPLTAVGQAIVLVALVVVPEVAAMTAGAALVLLIAAVGASLVLSATGAAADEGSRRAALGALLVVSWLSGLAIAVVRRRRSGPRSPRPVS